MAEIKLTNVGKSFRNEGKGGWIAAVSNVSLDVADHEFITIIDPSERRELTVIYAAYDLPEAMALGDRVVSLQDGKIEWVRTPEDILKEQLEKKSTEVQSEA